MSDIITMYLDKKYIYSKKDADKFKCSACGSNDIDISIIFSYDNKSIDLCHKCKIKLRQI